MLEFPESNILAKQLEKTLAGRTVIKAEAGHSPHGFAFYCGDPAAYADFLAGARIDGAAAYGGMTEVSAEEKRLLFGDGANLRYLPAGTKVPDKHQLYLEFDDGSLVIGTIQMYGMLFAFREGELDNPYYKIAREKPSPLSGLFSRTYFESLLSGLKPTMSVKGFLATEQRIPGLGNGVLQDILFNAGVHPKNKVSSLASGDLDMLYTSVRKTLDAMMKGGGRDTEKDLFGNAGGYRTVMSKNSYMYPCPRCAGPVRKEAYMGGSVYYCPECQK